MAHRTKNRGTAPRTLFSLDRSSNKRGARGDTVPEDPSEVLDEVAPDDVDEMTAIETADTASDGDVGSDEASAAPEPMPAQAEPCPSCESPLVAGAMFCGECGSRVSTEATGADGDDETSDDDPDTDQSDDGHGLVAAAAVGAGPAGAKVEDDAALDLDDDPDAELTAESDDSTGVLVGAGVGVAAAMGATGAMAEPAGAYGSSGSVGGTTTSGGLSGGGRKRFWLVTVGVAAILVVIALLAFSGGSSSKKIDDLAASAPESTTTQASSSSVAVADATTPTTTDTTAASTDTSTTVAALPGSSTTVTTTGGGTPSPQAKPTTTPGPQPTSTPPTSPPPTTIPLSPASINATPNSFFRITAPITMTLTNTGDMAGSWSISTSNNHILVNGSQSASGTVPGHGTVYVTFTRVKNWLPSIVVTLNLAGHTSQFAAFVY